MLLELHLDLLRRLAPLATAGADIRISLMPESPDAYLSISEGNRGVLMMSDSTFTAPDTPASRSQRWLVRFALELRHSSNWTAAGMMNLLEAALRLLVGYRPPQGDRVVLERTVLDGEFEQFWVHRIVFHVPCRLVADVPEETEISIAALIRRIQGLRATDPDETILNVEIPGPEVNPPTALTAAIAVNGQITLAWAPPAAMADHTVVGYVVQLRSPDGVWSASRLLHPDATGYTYPESEVTAIAPTAARVLAMWELENSEWASVNL